MRFTRLQLLCAAALVTLPVFVIYGRESLAVDACLDSGGSFDYARLQCDPQSDHPGVPFSPRGIPR